MARVWARGAAPQAVRLCPFPLFHVSGMGTAISTVMTGGKTVWPLGCFEASLGGRPDAAGERGALERGD